MIFKPILVDKILKGQKTMTRRPVKPYVAPESPWILTRSGRRRRRPVPRTKEIGGQHYLAPYRIGRAIPVQKGRGKRAVAHIEATQLRTEPVGDITLRDAQREGFKTTAAFKAYWIGLYDHRWLATLDEPNVDDLVARFDNTHADTLVWVITFTVVDAPAQYLARAAGYTSVRGQSIDQPEPHDPDPAIVEENPSAGDDGYLKTAIPYRPATARKPRPLLTEVREALKTTLAERYRGWEPEDVHADNPQFGSPGDIRALRREMGLRGTDGLEPIAAGQLEHTLDGMLLRGASTRDIALAADWSQSKAQRWVAARDGTSPSELAA